jgi:hypothetical protein
LWLSIAAVLAPLLSIVIFAGVPFHLIALRKNRSAALRSRLAVNKKSIVAPALSTARYKYFQAPLIFTIYEHPAIERGVVDLDAVLFHHLFELTLADRIRYIPANGHRMTSRSK